MFSIVSKGVEDSIAWENWKNNISALWVKYPKFNINFQTCGLNVSNKHIVYLHKYLRSVTCQHLK